MSEKISLESKKSYRHLIDGGFFRDNATGENNAIDQIKSRYKSAFMDIQNLLEKFDLSKHATINPSVLWKANLDFFEDVARMKHFHGIKDLQPEKEYAYEVFWFLRNHPIQINSENEIPEKYLFVNEIIFTHWLIHKMYVELANRFEPNIQIDDLVKKLYEDDLMHEFSKKLYYTFRYRIYTTQTLLLTIEGFMAAAQFTLKVT